MPERALFVKPVLFDQRENEFFAYNFAAHALGGLQLPSGAPLPNSMKMGSLLLQRGEFVPARVVVRTFEDSALGPLIVTPNGKEWVRNPLHDDAGDFRAKWLRWCDGNRDRLYVRSYLNDEVVLANVGWPRHAVVPEELAGPEPHGEGVSSMWFMLSVLDPFPHGENPETEE
jgi:hypothetical protein